MDLIYNIEAAFFYSSEDYMKLSYPTDCESAFKNKQIKFPDISTAVNNS